MLAHFLSSHIPDAKDKEAIIRYGLELMLTTFIGFLLMVGVSIIGQHPFAWLPFVIGFAPLRTTAGGFHASSHLGCYSITTITFSVCMAMAFLLEANDMLNVLIAGLSFVTVVLFSPMEAQNKPLSPKNRTANRRISLMISLAELVASLLLFQNRIHSAWVQLFYYGILAATVSVVAAKIKILTERRFRNES